MSDSRIRVRFAPSPTGLMHLGNVRTALMNYLFALQKDGTFVLRIEDTDPERNFDPGAKQIISDLCWLKLDYAEGPQKGGPFEPYFQSQRMVIYKQKLQELEKMGLIYRCFCTTEKLEQKRQRQIALRTAPRYDRTCLKLPDDQIQEKVAAGIPFIWRVKLDHEKDITIQDIAHGTMTFQLKNFSDFPITRQNGTFTFMFANFVDDMTMKISHVLRGEDHLTNTAGQAVLFEAFKAQTPTFWHLPILCNISGKKLSKRDFGFALKDLREAGYLPEAITNYLAIIGGSFEQEIMSLKQLSQAIDFDHAHAKGQIKYDVEKLNWVNHKWIAQYDAEKLTELCRPYLVDRFTAAKDLDSSVLKNLIEHVKTDLTTLADVSTVLAFYFEEPEVTTETVSTALDKKTLDTVANLVAQGLGNITNPDNFLGNLKKEAKTQKIELKALFSFLRFGLMGATRGPGIKELLEMLGAEKSRERLEHLIEITKK